MGVWILASVAFAFYVANFGSYNETYGSLGGVIVFLVWLWITNNAILPAPSSTRRSSGAGSSRQAYPAPTGRFSSSRAMSPRPKTAGIQPRDEEASNTARR